MLSRIVRPKKVEVGETRRKLHDEELHNLYTSNSVRMIKSCTMSLVRRIAPMGMNIYAVTPSVRNPKGKTPLGSHTGIGKDNIEMNLKDILWECVA
jgi:hypothetical protein